MEHKPVEKLLGLVFVFVFVFSLLLPTPSLAHQRLGCKSKDPVFCQIKATAPKLNSRYVRRLSFHIKKSAKAHGISPRLLTAIVGAESSFQPIPHTKHNPAHGLTQIATRTARAYGFDVKKLSANMGYSINAGAIVLKWFKKTYAHREKFWYVRYNCGTQGDLNRSACVKYKSLVLRWW